MLIFPSIDVEGVHGDRPYEQMILGDIGGRESWGAPRLATIFQRIGIRATFFVDCYECSLWGADCMEQICHVLSDLGQDVQLHTHPGWRDDPRDAPWLRRHKNEKSYLSSKLDFMAKLTYEQQVEILEEGIDMFERWLGRRPVAHRSGGYSINADTLRALSTVGIPVDSSMNAAHSNSQLVWSRNRVVHQDGVLELPVTILNYAAAGKLLKTDLDVCSLADLNGFVRKGLALGLRFMNLFMHSYSLLDYDPLLRRPYSVFRPSRIRLQILERFLESAVSNPQLQFVTAEEARACYQSTPEKICGSDAVPVLLSPPTLLRHASRKAQRKITSVWEARRRSTRALEVEAA